MRNGGRGFRAPAAVLDKRGDNDLRISIWGEANEPCVFLVLLVRLPGIFAANDLGRSGLSTDLEAVHIRVMSGAAGFMHHAPHRFGDEVHSRFLNRIILFDHFAGRKY